MKKKTFYKFKWEYRNCIVCGKKFIAKNYNSVRCFECQAIHKAQTERERVQRIRAEKNIRKDHAQQDSVRNIKA